MCCRALPGRSTNVRPAANTRGTRRIASWRTDSPRMRTITVTPMAAARIAPRLCVNTRPGTRTTSKGRKRCSARNPISTRSHWRSAGRPGSSADRVVYRERRCKHRRRKDDALSRGRRRPESPANAPTTSGMSSLEPLPRLDPVSEPQMERDEQDHDRVVGDDGRPDEAKRTDLRRAVARRPLEEDPPGQEHEEQVTDADLIPEIPPATFCRSGSEAPSRASSSVGLVSSQIASGRTHVAMAILP